MENCKPLPLQSLKEILLNRQNFETAILNCSYNKTKHKAILSKTKSKNIYSEKIIRNSEIHSSCAAFSEEFVTRINNIQTEILNAINAVCNKEDSRNYIKNQINKLNEILLNAIKIHKTYNKNSIETLKAYMDKLIEFDKKINIDIKNPDRTPTDYINTRLEIAQKINEYDNSFKNELLFATEKIHEDVYYLLQIDNCIRKINNLQNDIVIEIFDKEELAKIIETKETEDFIIKQFNFNNEASTTQTDTSEKEMEIDLSDTKANGKIIYLKELGILDFLREKSPFNTSINTLATVLSAITGAKLTTLQPYLNPMFNLNAEQKNNPYNNKKNVDKVKTQLINAGFQLK